MSKRVTGQATGQVEKSVLTLETIAELSNGQAAGAINAAIKQVINDTEDRGGDKKPRKVTITLEFKKLGEDMITTTVKATTTIPPYVTEATYGNIKIVGNQSHVEFNPNSASNPDQRTFGNDGDEV